MPAMACWWISPWCCRPSTVRVLVRRLYLYSTSTRTCTSKGTFYNWLGFYDFIVDEASQHTVRVQTAINLKVYGNFLVEIFYRYTTSQIILYLELLIDFFHFYSFSSFSIIFVAFWTREATLCQEQGWACYPKGNRETKLLGTWRD